MNLSMNKKGASYWFIYALAFGFVLTILYIIFGQVLQEYLYPTTIIMTGGGANMAEADKWLSFWAYVPFIIVLFVLLFMYFRMTQLGPQGE